MSGSQPTSANRAVFLSYASQDAQAAHRICEALRAAAVEVWFDKSELVGGDAWDAKIRKQIGACALFIPVVSANTQARKEGYFRLEWKLAEDRSQFMAKGVPFIIPVSVDGTAERGALVPDAFMAVQWTRLPGGETPAAFAKQVRELLDESGAPAPAALAVLLQRDSSAAEMPRRSKIPIWCSAVVAAGFLGAVAYLEFRPAAKEPAGPPQPIAETNASGQFPATVAPADKSIAVLPFTNMSENKDNAYFADGVQEDLLTDLANIRELKVISRTSVMRYRDTTKTIHQIAAELGVAFILEGSVRHSGDRIRVTGQLINASTDEHIWAKTYDRDLIDIFAVQTDLSHEIATALQAVLTPQENIRLEMRPTKSVAAYELYQQAMAVVSKGVAHLSLEQALPLLERAVEIDPSYAKAWVQIYWLQDFAYWHENRPASRLASMRDAIAHAEQADRNDFDVLFAAANLGGAIDDRAMVGHYRQQIVELYPNRAEAYLVLADTAVDEGRRKDAWSAYENARALDPLNKGVLSSLDFFLLINRRYARAEEIEQAIVQLDPEDNDAALRLASTPFFRTGSTLELKSLLARLPEDLEMKDPVIRTSRFRVMVELGDSEGMIRLWQKSGGNVTAVAPNRQVRMLMAATYLERNDVASARTLLQQSRDDAQAQLVGNPTMLDAVNDLGLALAMLGDQEGAKAKLAQAQDILNRLAPGQEVEARFESILVRAWTGEKAKVIADLAQMMRSPLMGEARLNVHGLRVFQLMLPLRGDPAFEVVLNDPANNAPLF